MVMNWETSTNVLYLTVLDEYTVFDNDGETFQVTVHYSDSGGRTDSSNHFFVTISSTLVTICESASIDLSAAFMEDQVTRTYPEEPFYITLPELTDTGAAEVQALYGTGDCGTLSYQIESPGD